MNNNSGKILTVIDGRSGRRHWEIGYEDNNGEFHIELVWDGEFRAEERVEALESEGNVIQLHSVTEIVL